MGVLPLLQEQAGVLHLNVEQIEGSSLSFSSIALLVFLLLVLIMIASYLLYQLWARQRSKSNKKVRARIEEKSYHEKAPATFSMEHIFIEDEVEKHLKEDERVIVRILRQREGKCEQGTLCIVSNFSKATLSRLLGELEMRGIVRRDRQGKKNMVYLRI